MDTDTELTLRFVPAKGGRPPARVRRQKVSTYLPVTTFDRIARIARRRGVSVSQLLAGLIDGALRHEEARR
jgi:predicted DNA-binding ribbon-helix-helix protein